MTSWKLVFQNIFRIPLTSIPIRWWSSHLNSSSCKRLRSLTFCWQKKMVSLKDVNLARFCIKYCPKIRIECKILRRCRIYIILHFSAIWTFHYPLYTYIYLYINLYHSWCFHIFSPILNLYEYIKRSVSIKHPFKKQRKPFSGEGSLLERCFESAPPLSPLLLSSSHIFNISK